jgi:hypothetical protein
VIEVVAHGYSSSGSPWRAAATDTRCGQVQEGADHLPQIDDGGAAHLSLSFHQRSDQLPLLIRQIGRIASLRRGRQGRVVPSSSVVPTPLSQIVGLPKRPLRCARRLGCRVVGEWLVSPGHADEGSWERTAVVIDVSTLRIFGCEGRCGESTCLVDPRTAAQEDIHVSIRRRLLVVIAPLVLIGALVAGCGGSSKKGSGYLLGPGQVTAQVAHSGAA